MKVGQVVGGRCSTCSVGAWDFLLPLAWSLLAASAPVTADLNFAENWQRFMRNHNAYRWYGPAPGDARPCARTGSTASCTSATSAAGATLRMVAGLAGSDIAAEAMAWAKRRSVPDRGREMSPSSGMHPRSCRTVRHRRLNRSGRADARAGPGPGRRQERDEMIAPDRRPRGIRTLAPSHPCRPLNACTTAGRSIRWIIEAGGRPAECPSRHAGMAPAAVGAMSGLPAGRPRHHRRPAPRPARTPALPVNSKAPMEDQCQYCRSIASFTA